MSKFFAAGNASDDDSQNQIDEDQMQNKPTTAYKYKIDDFRNDDDRKPRVILTEKQKKWMQIKKIIGVINTALNNKDYDKVWDNLQQLIKNIQKSQKIIQKQGYPPFFLKTLIKVNDAVNEVSNEEKKNMKKNSATSFNSMKQKLKSKIMPTYQKQILLFKQKPQQEQQQSQSSSEEQIQQSQSQEDDDGDVSLLDSDDPMVRRRFWLKKKKQVKQKQEEQEVEKPKPTKPQEQPKKHLQKKQKATVQTAKPSKKSVLGATSKEAEAQLFKMVKNFYKLANQQQRQDYLHTLNEIFYTTQKYTDVQKLSFLLTDIPIRVQVLRQMKLTHFTRNNWIIIFQMIQKCYTILRESEIDHKQLIQNIIQFTLKQSAEKVKNTQESLYNNLKAFIIILENELRKAFTYLDNNDIQYSYRLQDLIKFVDFMYKISRQMLFKEQLEKSSAELAFKVIENMYFMNSDFMKKIKAEYGKNFEFVQLEDEVKLQHYADNVLKYESQDNVTKTVLYLAYNHAINYRKKAKDMLIMSNVPNIITKCDYYTQSMYNRVIVQIGLCSFHDGKLHEVQQFLSELCGIAKVKETTKDIIRQFLAQGGKANGPQIRKNKTLPYYLHLNCELIESIELISSMILQVPYLLTENGRITSKTFRRVVSEYQRSHFIAQPIHSKDLIYAASKSLKLANWKEAYDRLMQLYFWKEMSDLNTIKSNLLANIKQQALRCYLIGNRKCFTSISIEGLTKKFELPTRTVRKLVCKWIYENKELKGSITSDGYLQITQKKQTHMQKVSQELFNKLQDIMKANESIYQSRVNMFVTANNPLKKQVNEDAIEGIKEDEDIDKDAKPQRRTNKAMTEKLKANLIKRN